MSQVLVCTDCHTLFTPGFTAQASGECGNKSSHIRSRVFLLQFPVSLESPLFCAFSPVPTSSTLALCSSYALPRGFWQRGAFCLFAHSLHKSSVWSIQCPALPSSAVSCFSRTARHVRHSSLSDDWVLLMCVSAHVTLSQELHLHGCLSSVYIDFWEEVYCLKESQCARCKHSVKSACVY